MKLKLCVLVALVAAVLGCGSHVVAPGPDAMHAALEITAKAIVESDKVCASVADALIDSAATLPELQREARIKVGGELAHKCGVAARKGLQALAVGEDAVNAYTEGKTGSIGCAAQQGLSALREIEQLVVPYGRPLPPINDHAWTFTTKAIELLGASCPVGG